MYGVCSNGCYNISLQSLWSAWLVCNFFASVLWEEKFFRSHQLHHLYMTFKFNKVVNTITYLFKMLSLGESLLLWLFFFYTFSREGLRLMRYVYWSYLFDTCFIFIAFMHFGFMIQVSGLSLLFFFYFLWLLTLSRVQLGCKGE